MTRWQFTAADGTVVELGGPVAWSGSTYVVDDGTTGLLAPGYEFDTDSYAGVDGEVLKQITPQAATPALALDLVGTGTATLAARVRALAHALRPRLGVGVLTATADDGTVRRLPCRYRKGLESGKYTDNRFRAVLEFWSPSPWWRGNPLSVGWSLAAPQPFFPIPPVTLSSTSIAGTATIDLSGCDAPTYPLAVVTGPGDQLTLQNTYAVLQPDGVTWQNVTQSLVLPVPGGIGDGGLVVVDMRPGQQSVRRATGTPPVVTEQRRNLVPNPAPASASSYSANYGTTGAGALSYSGSGGPSGGGFVRATWSTASTAVGTGQLRYDGRAGQPLPIPVTPGQVLSAAAQVRCSVAQRLALQVTWFDASGGQTGITPTGAAGPPVVVAPDTWTRLVNEGITVPAGAAYCLIGPQAVTGTGAVVFPVGATLDVAQTLLELATATGTYFDGATAQGPGSSYVWAGTPNASQSVLSSVVTPSAYTLGASLFGSLASDPAMWPLVDGLNSVTALLTNAGPASAITFTADRLYSGAM